MSEPTATQLGVAARKRNAVNYREVIKTLVPIAQRLAKIFGDEGITASTVRRHSIRMNLIREDSPMHYLSSVMKQAGLVTKGETRPSTVKATKGRRQLIYYPATSSPYSD